MYMVSQQSTTESRIVVTKSDIKDKLSINNTDVQKDRNTSSQSETESRDSKKTVIT